jgi:hypothetical protein
MADGLDGEGLDLRLTPLPAPRVLARIRSHLLDRLAEHATRFGFSPEPASTTEPEIFQLKPTLYGVGVDLKALWRRLSGRK